MRQLLHVHVHCSFFFTAECSSEASSSFGSQRSLFSSACTLQESSLKESYVKGVDGQVFKDRMQVSNY